MARKLYMRFPGGRAKALTLSYDDGVEQDIRLMDILDRHGLRCTFNLNSGCYAAEGHTYAPGTIHRRLPASRVSQLYATDRHEVAVHSLTHPRLEVLPPSAVTQEVLQDRLNLEAQFGRIVRGMAYPYGSWSDAVVDCLRACGIAYARTTASTGRFDVPTDWLRMPATCHHGDARLPELTSRFLEMKPGDKPQLFYLWGHSYEFEANDNWDVIERFAEQTGGRDDIWYATNIEIYDYVQDFNRLLWSADMCRVTNPTARTLYLRGEGKDFSLNPGETAVL